MVDFVAAIFDSLNFSL